LAYDGSPLNADFLDTVMGFLGPAVAKTLLYIEKSDTGIAGGPPKPDAEAFRINEWGVERARELGRRVPHKTARGDAGEEIVREAIDGEFDALFMSLRGHVTANAAAPHTLITHGPNFGGMSIRRGRT